MKSDAKIHSMEKHENNLLLHRYIISIDVFLKWQINVLIFSGIKCKL